ncbi:MAG: RDD family protein [Verrucomicrobiota bacterium]
MKYAGFWQRLIAGLIDFFVLLIPSAAIALLSGSSKTLAFICETPLGLLYWGYTFYFLSKRGQTIGKQAICIRVVNIDGSKITQTTAFRRCIVDLCIGIISTIGALWGIACISPEEFVSLTWTTRNLAIQKFQPNFIRWVDIASTIWVCSEVLVVIFNVKKRALHDFIAGTVVIVDSVPGEPIAGMRKQHDS